MKYIVAGKLTDVVNTDLQDRIRMTGGWRERTINGQQVMWNACVSPPFGGGDVYEF